MLKIGIDVGGTNTDGVLIEDDVVIQKIKIATKENIGETILDVAKKLLILSNTPAVNVNFVMIGTTHFLNAFLQQKQISRVSVVRLCLPTGSFLPPLIDWPHNIKSAINDHYYFAHGGYLINGKPISSFNEHEVVEIAKKMQSSGATAVAISMPFSFINHDMEIMARDIIKQFNPNVAISCSYQFPQQGLLERENSTVINASLMHYANTILNSIEENLLQLLGNAKIYVSGNDGALLNIKDAMMEPVRTFASGPTNSMRGAYILTGLKNAVVADVGGTSTDVGILINGFPRKRSIYSDLCGIRSSFSIPDVISIPIGGGTIVKMQDVLTLGPESVGARLESEALCFGGNVLTLTDVYYAAQRVGLPNATMASGFTVNDDLKNNVIAAVQNYFEQTIDKIKSSKNAVPLIAIGGGAYMLQQNIAGIADIIKPQHYEVANALGAASGEISGEGQCIFDYDVIDRREALDGLTEQVFSQAIRKGADRATLAVAEIREIPTPYMPGRVNRVYVKVVGKLQS